MTEQSYVVSKFIEGEQSENKEAGSLFRATG